MGYCETGKAIITAGYNLKASRIIHAVGPICIDGKHNEAEILVETYKSVLSLANTYMIHEIAFPIISSGSHGFPIEEAISIALDTCIECINQGYNMSIKIVTTNEKIFHLSEQLLDEKIKKIFTPDDFLFNLDYQILKNNIDYFSKYNSVKWEGGTFVNETIHPAYPVYPEGMCLYELLIGLGGFDYDYNIHMKMMDNKKISEMSILQIRTFFTYVIHGEKFCDGHIAEHMQNRSILKACLRLDDLREKIIEYK